MNTYELEISPSSRTECCKCKNKIKKDTLRMKIQHDVSFYGQPVYKFTCEECITNHLHEIKNELEDELSKIKTLLVKKIPYDIVEELKK